MNHYKARIQELEESRLKLIQDARAAREECAKVKVTLKRVKARLAKISEQARSPAPANGEGSHLLNP